MNKIYLRVFAGLGNQQFQYAYAKALAVKYRKELILDISYFKPRFHPVRSQGYLYPYKLKHFNVPERNTGRLNREMIGIINMYGKFQKLYQTIQKMPLFNQFLPILLTQGNFNESILSEDKNIILSGYFQKNDIFETIQKTIQDTFTYSGELSKENKRYLSAINKHTTVSIHLRRGDYVQKENVKNNFAPLTKEFFIRSIQYITKQTDISRLVIFSDDIEWVKENIVFPYKCIYIENNGPDYEHQYLMSKCNHQIISNSTYSWWAAWLNRNNNKIICIPEKWFRSSKRKNDIYIPSKWIKIGN